MQFDRGVLKCGVSDIVSSSFPPNSENGKWMYNGDNTFTSKRQKVYSSNTSVSDALDKTKIQNNNDLLLTNP